MNCVWNAQLKEEVELKGEHKGGMLRARKKCTHGDCGKKHRSKFGWLTRGLKNCDKLAAKVRETQMKQHSGEQMHCNVFMARDNPKKEGVLEEPNRNKDSSPCFRRLLSDSAGTTVNRCNSYGTNWIHRLMFESYYSKFLGFI